MITKELLAYIKDLETRGIPQPEIEKNLLSAGWDNEDLKEAYAEIHTVPKYQDFPKTAASAAPVTFVNMPSTSAPIGQPNTISVKEEKPVNPGIQTTDIPTYAYEEPQQNIRQQSVQQQPIQEGSEAIYLNNHNTKRRRALTIAVLVLLLILGGSAYAYLQGIWPFGGQLYTGM